MDWIAKYMGGRKFVMAALAMGVATYLESKGGSGLSSTMAGFLVGIVGLFSAANYASSSKHADTSKLNSGDFKKSLDSMQAKIDEAMNPEAMASLTQILSGIHQGMNEVKGTTGQMGVAMVNIGNQLTKRG